MASWPCVSVPPYNILGGIDGAATQSDLNGVCTQQFNRYQSLGGYLVWHGSATNGFTYNGGVSDVNLVNQTRGAASTAWICNNTHEKLHTGIY